MCRRQRDLAGCSRLGQCTGGLNGNVAWPTTVPHTRASCCYCESERPALTKCSVQYNSKKKKIEVELAVKDAPGVIFIPSSETAGSVPFRRGHAFKFEQPQARGNGQKEGALCGFSGKKCWPLG